MIEQSNVDRVKYRNQEDTMEHNNDTSPTFNVYVLALCQLMQCVSCHSVIRISMIHQLYHMLMLISYSYHERQIISR